MSSELQHPAGYAAGARRNGRFRGHPVRYVAGLRLYPHDWYDGGMFVDSGGDDDDAYFNTALKRRVT